MSKFFEQQYEVLDTFREKYGHAKMGSMSSFTWNNDPKRLLFVLSRYKAVASILQGEMNVLEVGCGDSFASRIVCQSVESLTVSDADSKLIDEAKQLSCEPFVYECLVHDFEKSTLVTSEKETFSAAYLLDVLEHIHPENQYEFLKNISSSLASNARVIIGMPSRESQLYASPESKAGHINCQSKSELAESLKKNFQTVTIFSMNDEVLHTGYAKMSHYLLAICTK